jgi:PPOX class probable F420-dependent enzyme
VPLSDHVGIAVIDAGLRRRIGRARVAHFATTDGREPALVPVCFVLLGNAVYHAIDAKPKSAAAGKLRRVRNVRANSSAALLVDHYEDDWRRLWFVLIRGRARVIEKGVEHDRAIEALRRKYPQYRTQLPLPREALVIALDLGRISHWRANSPGRRCANRTAP